MTMVVLSAESWEKKIFLSFELPLQGVLKFSELFTLLLLFKANIRDGEASMCTQMLLEERIHFIYISYERYISPPSSGRLQKWHKDVLQD